MQYVVMYFLFWNTLVKTLLWRTPWRTPGLGISITFETILRSLTYLILDSVCLAHFCVQLRLPLQNNKNSATNCYNDQPPYAVAQGLYSGMDLCLTYRDGGG
jgi:hypothetical protein